MKKQEAIKIAEELIQSIEVSPYTVSNVRTYSRLVDMLEKEDEIQWVNKELYGYGKSEDCPFYRKVRSRYRNKFAFIKDGYSSLIIYSKDKVIRYPYNDDILILRSIVLLNILGVVDNIIYQRTSDILSQLKFERSRI